MKDILILDGMHTIDKRAGIIYEIAVHDKKHHVTLMKVGNYNKILKIFNDKDFKERLKKILYTASGLYDSVKFGLLEVPNLPTNKEYLENCHHVKYLDKWVFNGDLHCPTSLDLLNR